ncbi:C40 family peptidase [Pelosinus baikalensis]|uniref:NlpC/P60 family protein n=1 Tax=Pelosinus baikalensis TaxID=2892015 RepID=A0ABS8HPF6_9FIRM|nr:NlpC/P60 family protein [Pelosinus baikalensis]MCC5465082.1 NlpC/P60 family protein [Pelosinus baikalensis]
MIKISKNIISLVVCCAMFFIIYGSAEAQSLKLQLGMSGEAVYLLQSKLQELGFYSGELDEKFGSGTLNAVIRFQEACDLEADGIVGAQTLAALHQYKTGNISSRGQMTRRPEKNIGSFAQKFINVPYQWGGSSPSGFDCSGFIYYIFNQYGIFMPRMADEQFKVGLAIRVSELQAGDLVFFSTYEPGPSHVGIYIGNDQFIHASSAAERVIITALSKPYYQARYLGARRML